MSNPSLKVTNATGDTNAAITGKALVYAVHARNSGTAASSVLLYDALTITGTAKINMAANSSDAGVTFQEFYTVDFAVPVMFTVGVTIDVTAADIVNVYWS